MYAQIKHHVFELWVDPRVRASTIAVLSIIAAYLVEFVFRRTLMVLASRTKTDLDDEVVRALRRPIFASVLLGGLAWAASIVVSVRHREPLNAGLKTIAILVWTAAAFRIATSVLSVLSRRAKMNSIVQPRTQPVFDMVAKIFVVGAAVYFTFLAWDIDVTAWLASAGIVGIAVGFAAKDTLANLFAGIFIVADAPYKVGDFIVLGTEELRGEVIKIGIRSTRILTLDGVEITVPNAIIGNDKIVNEDGGPDLRQRVNVQVEAAYGSDSDAVEAALLRCPDGVDGVCEFPAPKVRFQAFGGSGLVFRLLVWVEDARAREGIVSALHHRVYKELNNSGIEIPYSKHDVYIKQMPEREAETPERETETPERETETPERESQVREAESG